MNANDLDEIRAGITVYTFKDGVEHRKPAFPDARVRVAFRQLSESMTAATSAFERWNEALGAAISAARPGVSLAISGPRGDYFRRNGSMGAK